ncbi:MAG: hypothetical protein ACI9T8_000608 [Candidatus Saccharimonadales bacterium]|jgi:hypothetical protein
MSAWQTKPIPEESTKELDHLVLEWIVAVRNILPGLPMDISYVWDNNNLVSSWGTGGATINPKLIHIALDPEFRDKERQLRYLRATVYHELFHVVQGWSFFDNRHPEDADAISQAYMEGAAVVFERELVDADISYALPGEGEDLNSFYEELLSLDDDFDYAKYKFNDPETGRKYIIYKVGVWLIDQILDKNDLGIKELATFSPSELRQLTSKM